LSINAKIYAHSGAADDFSDFETLEEHSLNVGRATSTICKSIGAEEIGFGAGALHDLGKAKPAFQRRLRGSGEQVSHSGEGAKLAADAFGPVIGRMIAWAIAGHHSGLPNGTTRPVNGAAKPASTLNERLEAAEKLDWPHWVQRAQPRSPASLMTLPPGNMPHFELQFFTRMLFSALVDADSLETERFYEPDAPRERIGDNAAVQARLRSLRDALDARLTQFGPACTDVDRLRVEVLEAARTRAGAAPGLFSLSVPTGGGKTLASLAFALDHALANNLRRIIHVAPFTSIIEQTADVFREAVGDPSAVLEHHSDFDPFEREEEEEARRVRLAAENWARPVVVTTAVQFFESLFANRRSRCRKLHNIARSVIVLDEAQAMPAEFLRPCLAALQELVRGYGCSVVFCTATQPALWREDGLACLEAPSRAATTELAPDPPALHRRLKRVEARMMGEVSNAALCDGVAGRRALVILNNKKQARAIFETLRTRGAEALHLSTNMTPAHRRSVLADIRASGHEDARPVIATSLVEAGVDLDFPEVWRALAGVDSLVQAAGRCNRNGKLSGRGTLFIFEPEAGFPPPPELARRANLARDVLASVADPISPEAVRLFFQRLFHDMDAQLDAKGIMGRLRPTGSTRLDYPFADIAHDMRIIPELTVPLIIGCGPWGIGEKERRILQWGQSAGAIARAMQRFCVPVMPHVRNRLLADGAAAVMRAKEFGPRFAVLENSTLYDAQAGFAEGENWDLGFNEI
jgi:CRISPR-associated endonuclease/helicase Cas3